MKHNRYVEGDEQYRKLCCYFRKACCNCLGYFNRIISTTEYGQYAHIRTSDS